MKNHLVKALIDFNDYEGADINSGCSCKERKINDEFYCTKERYSFLAEKGAVALIGIDKIEENVETEIKKTVTPKKKASKK